MTTRVTDPLITRATPPGHRNRTVRLKYTDRSEMLAEIEESNRLSGRTECPICDWLRANPTGDVIEAENHLWTHPIWGPGLLAETMVNNLRFNNASTEHGEEIAASVQHDCALMLAEHPWDMTRPFIERMLRNPDMRFVSPEAKAIILGLMEENHPNPAKFLAQPDVRKKID